MWFVGIGRRGSGGGGLVGGKSLGWVFGGGGVVVGCFDFGGGVYRCERCERHEGKLYQQEEQALDADEKATKTAS